MTQQLSTHHPSGPSEVLELIQRRDTVQGWLARLDEQKGKVSERVLQRVREDYQVRLRETLDALAGHRRSIQDELDRATSRLGTAEEEHQAAVDELEEGRLRNAIGEIDPASWASRESELSKSVEAAAGRETEIRAETRRLTELLDQLDERQPASPVQPAAPAGFYVEDGTPLSTPDPDATIADDTWLDEPTLATDASAESGAAEEYHEDFPDESGADPFLGEIDRALSGAHALGGTPVDARHAAQTTNATESVDETAPKPGLKCSECGYTNDLSAWFCGVCGADIG